MIEHKVTGYLSKPYDCIDLANGISYISDLSCKDYLEMKNACIKKSKQKFCPKTIFEQYESLIISN